MKTGLPGGNGVDRALTVKRKSMPGLNYCEWLNNIRPSPPITQQPEHSEKEFGSIVNIVIIHKVYPKVT